MNLETIVADWNGLCIVAAPGPSLDRAVADQCRDVPVIAVNDAWRLFPFAKMLYACDAAWWRMHEGAKGFAGEKWSSHGNAQHNDKGRVADQFGLRLVRGRDAPGFSYDPAAIHYGNNGGFQAVNLAGHKIGWKGRIVLVGFDMRRVEGRSHFFGEHPPGLVRTTRGYDVWPKVFAEAAASLPASVEIVNATPGSALTCFRFMELSDALSVA